MKPLHIDVLFLVVYLMSANTELIVFCCCDNWMDCNMFEMSGDVHLLLIWLCLSVSLTAEIPNKKTNKITLNCSQTTSLKQKENILILEVQAM